MIKGQVSVISVVIIAFLVVSLIGASYMFAGPMVEKQSTISQHGSAGKFMLDLDKTIVDIARTCTTKDGCEERIRIPVPGSLMVDDDSNSMIYLIDSSQPLLTDAPVYLTPGNTDDVANYGEVQNPGYVTMEGLQINGQNKLRYVLHYRSLYNAEQGKTFNITLVGSGEGAGTTVVLNYIGTETSIGGGHLLSDLVNSKVNVKIL
ncbi:MAG: hypothetical protein JW754_01080 [Candidatus Aenigmarchaeota archaeon]|nr:hypothetical protein [Candidatus Aenigmarchaeota archaeon]